MNISEEEQNKKEKQIIYLMGQNKLKCSMCDGGKGWFAYGFILKCSGSDPKLSKVSCANCGTVAFKRTDHAYFQL